MNNINEYNENIEKDLFILIYLQNTLAILKYQN